MSKKSANPFPNGIYYIRLKSNGLFLTAKKSQFYFEPFMGDDSQHWQFSSNNIISISCKEVFDVKDQKGTDVILWPLKKGIFEHKTNQRWDWDGERIISHVNRYCVEAVTKSTGKALLIISEVEKKAESQLWEIVDLDLKPLSS